MIARLLLYPLLALMTAALALAGDPAYRRIDAAINGPHIDNPHNPVGAGAAHVSRARVLTSNDSLADLERVRNGDATDVYVSNRLGGPLELELSFTDAINVQSLPALPLRQVIAANTRVLISRIETMTPGQPSSYGVNLLTMPGDPHAIAGNVTYSLPVDENSSWDLGQVFHGGFSHTDEQNRFAVDLIVPVGTPVLAARGGVVMQVESGFDAAGL